MSRILRETIYQGTHVFVLCFAVDRRSSFNSVADKWVPIINELCPTVPILLVGCRCDARTSSSESITPSEGQALARKVGAVSYIECSAYDSTGVDDVFSRAAQIATDAKMKRCLVM
ncbi:Ras-like GTP-binding protein Rho1 [Taenia crassiceps]|uniref:Ras-like GTP-binding protein Rho1 n=1 Tax=Taenia crassiceps TaxID=6207 RepID=A0ABR4Q1U8_9CEST